MIAKDSKLSAKTLNSLKDKINAELALRGGQGSVYGYQDYISVAKVDNITSIDQWVHTMGTDINKGIDIINPNEKYISANEYNSLENKLKEWVKRDNPIDPAVAATTANTGCEASCTGLCQNACFSGCKGACTQQCSTTCGNNCVSGSQGADGS